MAPRPMSRREAIIRVCKWTTWGLGGMVLLFAALLGLAQTGFGKHQVTILISKGLSSSPSARVKLATLEGWIPWEMYTSRVQIQDQKGVWLDAEGLTLRISVWALLRGKLHILEAGISSVRVIRSPIGSPKTAPTRFAPPLWPPPIPPLLVDDLHIDRCVLETPLLGESVILNLKGEIRRQMGAEGLKGRLQVTRMDRPGSIAHISWIIRGDPPVLTVEARLEEPRSGVLPALLGMRRAPPVSLILWGRGPLGHWKGRMRFRGEGMGEINAVLSLHAGRELHLTANGSWDMAQQILPTSTKARAQMTNGTFSLDLSFGEDRFRLRTFRLGAEGLNLSAQGAWSPVQGNSEGRFAGMLRDFGPLGPGGCVSVRGTFRATAEFQEAGVTFGVETAKGSPFRVKRLSGEASILRQRGEGMEGFSIGLKAEGRLQGSSMREGIGGPVPGGPLNWSMSARWPPKGTIDISRLEVVGEALEVKFTGDLNPAIPRLQGRLTARMADPSVLLGHPFPGLEGPLEMVAELRGFREAETWALRIQEGHLRWSSRSPVHLVLGPELVFSASAQWGLSGLYLSSLRLQAAEFRADSRLALHKGKGMIQGSARVEVPDLTPLSARLGLLVEGKATVDLEVRGRFKRPEACIRLLGQDVVLGGVSLNELSMRIEIKELDPVPRARLELLMSAGAQTVRCRAHLTLHGGVLEIDDLSIQGNQAGLFGNLRMNLRDGSVSGRIAGKLRELALLGASPSLIRIQERPLRIEAEFRPSTKGQGLRISAQGHDLVSPWARIGPWTLDLQVEDIWKARTARGVVKVSAVRTGGISVEKGSLNVEGGAENMLFSLRAEGRWGGAFLVQARVLMQGMPALRRLKILGLQGRYRGIPFVLASPVWLRLSQKGFSLEGLKLKVKDGLVKARASLLSGEARLTLRWRDLPLKPLGCGWGWDLSGRLHGELEFDGGPQGRAEGRAAVHIVDIRIPSDAPRGLPPIRILARCSIQGNSLWGRFTLDGLGGSPLKGDVELPLSLSFTPPSVHFRPKGKVRGRVVGALDLGLLPSVLRPPDREITGRIRIDLRLRGSLEDPHLEGTLTLGNARWAPQARTYELPGPHHTSASRTIRSLTAWDPCPATLIESPVRSGPANVLSLWGWREGPR